VALLALNGLSKSFGGLQAVNRVSFDVTAGSIKALIGPNGSGKTTTFNLISGTLKPTAGSICFDGHEITGKKPYQICALGIGRTFQTPQLIVNATVLENILLGRHSRTKSEFLASALRLPILSREEEMGITRSMELLNFLGLAGLNPNMVASELPYGTQRLIEIARAMAVEPKIILMDEPAAGLDISETNELADILRRIASLGITILLIEHDMNLVMKVAGQITVLNYGQVIAQGTPKEIQNDEQVIKAYLGG
jgi:branched-chain amino acid transport system ATP-binding protein